MLPKREHRQTGVPRPRSTYRAWQRNNAVEWKGVQTVRMEHQPLIRNKKGEVNFSKKHIEEET